MKKNRFPRILRLTALLLIVMTLMGCLPLTNHTAQAASETKCYLIGTANAKVYGNSSLTGAAIGSVYPTDEITLLTYSSRYARIRYPITNSRNQITGYKTGYIARDQILIQYGGGYMARSTGYITTYRRPAAGSPAYGAIFSGDTVCVYGTRNGYTQVQYPAGGNYKYAWVKTDLVNRYIPDPSAWDIAFPVTSLTVTKGHTVSMTVRFKGNGIASANLTRSNSRIKLAFGAVNWRGSDGWCTASVSVTGLTAGTATLTFGLTGSRSLSRSITVTVKDPSEEVTITSVPGNISLEKGKSATVAFKFSGDVRSCWFDNGAGGVLQGSFSRVDWTNGVAYLTVKGVKAGTASFTFGVQGRSKSASRAITVTVRDSAASTLSLSGGTYPTSINQGSGFTVKGRVTSNYTIKSVNVSVYNASGTLVTGYTAYPNAKSYDLNSLDAQIHFGRCAAGTHTYKVTAADEKGSKQLLSVTFTVKKSKTPTVYLQSDSRWGGYYYGYASDYNERNGIHATISSGGCGLLAVVNALYYLNGQFINPKTMADWAVAWGYRPNGGTADGLAEALCRKKGAAYGIKWVKWASSLSGIKNDLAGGAVAVVHVQGHFISVVDYDASSRKYLVLDSYPSSNRLGYGVRYKWITADEFTGKLALCGSVTYPIQVFTAR